MLELAPAGTCFVLPVEVTVAEQGRALATVLNRTLLDPAAFPGAKLHFSYDAR